VGVVLVASNTVADSGGFFSVCLEVFYQAVELGLNEACLYLVYARGTGRGNAESSWSNNALTKYAGVSRGRAIKAQERLLESGLVTKIKGGKHPRFKLSIASDSDLAWMPNELITGVGDEVTVLERVRQTADPMLLRLLVDLYSKANIAEDGGVSSEVVFQSFSKKPVAKHKQFNVFGFSVEHLSAYQENPIVSPHVDPSLSRDERCGLFFGRVTALEDLGAIYFIPTVFESETGEVLFPLVDPFTQFEVMPLTKAAEAMLPEEYAAVFYEFDYVIPIPRHLGLATVMGVVVLRYRQQTNLTKAGYAATKERVEKWSTLFGGSKPAISRVNQGYIKDTSRVIQGDFKDKSKVSQ
jgi:hypothetical protein